MITNCFPDLGSSSRVSHSKTAAFPPCSSIRHTENTFLHAGGTDDIQGSVFLQGSSPTSEMPSGALWEHRVTAEQPARMLHSSYGWTTAAEVLQPRLAQICPGFHLCFYLTVLVQTTGIIHHHWCVCERELSHPLGERGKEKETQAGNSFTTGTGESVHSPLCHGRGRRSID